MECFEGHVTDYASKSNPKSKTPNGFKKIQRYFILKLLPTTICDFPKSLSWCKLAKQYEKGRKTTQVLAHLQNFWLSRKGEAPSS